MEMSKRNGENGNLVTDFIFSWSLGDIFNGDLFNEKVSFFRLFPSRMFVNIILVIKVHDLNRL